jgi:predicted Na+-dependent transporter
VSWRDIIGAIGSWVFVGTAIVLAVGLLAGYLAGLGRPGTTTRVTMLGTAQRNISAALVVASSLGGDVTVLAMVAGILIPVVLIVLAGELGRRIAADPAGAPGEATA